MQLPAERSATVDIIVTGGLTSTSGGVLSSCTLVRDGDRVVVVDPGMVERAAVIAQGLADRGVALEAVTDVVLSHHHPDHTMHAGMFPNAAVHDHWAVYRGIDWEDSDCDGRVVAPSVILARTPGHTAEDLATIIGTADGVVVCSHSWFTGTSAVDDEDPEDPDAMRESRRRILEIADLIIPGHGPAFRPTAETPR